jgi:lipoyl(octanoyl) transferase
LPQTDDTILGHIGHTSLVKNQYNNRFIVMPPSHMSQSAPPLIIRNLGQRDYVPVWREMQAFTAARTPDTTDELWVVEHPAVFTLGLNGKAEHLLNPGDIQVIQVDRGGQVTYHGPGQLVVYTLLDIQRRQLGVKELVRYLEQAIITLLADCGIQAEGREDAPGVYVAGAKIAALGLRVKKGRTYHGLALNIDMELSPFSQINPCGYAGMTVTQTRDLGITAGLPELRDRLIEHLRSVLGYNVAPVPSLNQTA